MSEAFAHLHVASGFSLRYGASTPATLVERAAALGQPALALTDRDGLYGAIRFVQACDDAGIAPVLGVDLGGHEPASTRLSLPVHPAARPSAPGCSCRLARLVRGTPAGRRHRGGRPPRAARGAGPTRCVAASTSTRVTPASPSSPAGRLGRAAPGAGWGRLCRLVTSTHLSGERGAPVSSAALLAEHATDPRNGDLALTVLLGPDSDVGRALLASDDPTGPGPCCTPGGRCCRGAASSSRWSTTAARSGSPASLGHAGAAAGAGPRGRRAGRAHRTRSGTPTR